MALAVPAQVRVRPMQPDDVPSIIHIERQSFASSWQPEAFYRELSNPTARYLVAESPAGEVVGFIGMWVVIDESHITTLAVQPEWRQRGIGRRLLAGLLLEGVRLGARRVTLEVRTSNTEAIALYRKFGFHQVAVIARYYHDTNEDALVMVLRGVDRVTVQERIRALAASGA